MTFDEPNDPRARGVLPLMDIEDVKSGFIIAILSDNLSIESLDITAKEILFRTVAAFQPRR